VIDRADLAALPPVEAIDALPVEALPAFVTRLAALTAAAGARLVAEGSTQAAHEPMTLEQVAEHLHVSRKRVLELTREAGGLPRIEVSRKEILVRRSDLTAWLARRLVAPPTILYSSPHHDRRRTPQGPQAARPDAGATRQGTRRPLELRGALGTGRGRHLRARGEAAAHPGEAAAGEKVRKEDS